MAEAPNPPGSENLNIKNGNFICGVVEGKTSFIEVETKRIRRTAFALQRRMEINLVIFFLYYDCRVLWKTMDYGAKKRSVSKVGIVLSKM